MVIRGRRTVRPTAYPSRDSSVSVYVLGSDLVLGLQS